MASLEAPTYFNKMNIDPTARSNHKIVMSRLCNLLRLLHLVRAVKRLGTKMPFARDASVGAVTDDFHHL